MDDSRVASVSGGGSGSNNGSGSDMKPGSRNSGSLNSKARDAAGLRELHKPKSHFAAVNQDD